MTDAVNGFMAEKAAHRKLNAIVKQVVAQERGELGATAKRRHTR